ncbi:MAG: hypothetical protein JXA66_01680, partial [Oligoflexia bacterium]|nr:hypothetical protein [Oligoflexia bacterium]
MVFRLPGIISLLAASFFCLRCDAGAVAGAGLFFDVKQARTPNGMEIIYTPYDWGQPVTIMGIFIRGGAALRYKSKAGFALVAERYFSRRNGEMAKKYGFRFKSFLAWDYLAY